VVLAAAGGPKSASRTQLCTAVKMKSWSQSRKAPNSASQWCSVKLMLKVPGKAGVISGARTSSWQAAYFGQR
jgi:hypothetical protein